MTLVPVHEQKMRFARQLATGVHPFKAALEVLGEGRTSEAVAVHKDWSNDPVVLDEIERIKKELGDSLLISKEDYAEEVRSMAKSCKDEKAKVSLMNLYAEIRGFIGKNALVQVNNVTNRVLVVHSKGSNEDWGKNLEEQQLRLVRGDVA